MNITKKLFELCKNEEAQIRGFSGGLSQDYTIRLRELGFREGEFVRCLKTPPLGAPHIFKVSGCVFSLDNKISCEIELNVT